MNESGTVKNRISCRTMGFGALAGLLCGALLGTPASVHAGPPSECWTKVECAQIPLDAPCGTKCAHRNPFCGWITTARGLGFQAEETAPAGFENADWEGEAYCRTRQKCEISDVVCPENEEAEFICQNDGDSEVIMGYAEGYFLDEC